MSIRINNIMDGDKTGDPSKLFRKSGKLAVVIRPMLHKDLMSVSRIEMEVYDTTEVTE